MTTELISIEELIKNIKLIDEKYVQIDNLNDKIKISLLKDISVENSLKIIDLICDYENKSNEQLLTNLKELPVETLSEIFKKVLLKDDINDPLLILNIINLIKTYNTLDDSFFEDKDIYISSIEEFLDLKLDLSSEISQFIKKMSIYFLSLLKSYNKFIYSPTDNHCELPEIFKNIFLSVDLLTLCGIFSESEPFDTSECLLIEDASIYMTSLLMKGNISSQLLDMFFKEK